MVGGSWGRGGGRGMGYKCKVAGRSRRIAIEMGIHLVLGPRGGGGGLSTHVWV